MILYIKGFRCLTLGGTSVTFSLSLSLPLTRGPKHPADMCCINDSISFVRYGRDYRLTSRSSKEQRLLDQYSAQRGLGQLSNEYFLLADHSTGMYRQIFKTILAYSICISMQTVTSVLAASILRRHLMVWKIFAPRVIFDCVALIFTDVGLGVGFIFVIWLHRAFKKVVEHETTQFAKQS